MVYGISGVDPSAAAARRSAADASSKPATPSAGGESKNAGSPPASGQVTKNMFLQLLVAQLKNQDPLNPTDGVQFLSQLAQLQQLEQGVNTGEDIQAVRAALERLSPPPAGASAGS